MSLMNNQLQSPFSDADKAKLDAVEPGAKAYEIASEAEAEAGIDNVKLMTPLAVAQAIEAQAAGGSSSVITKSYTNNSGITIAAFRMVYQDTSGNMSAINPSIEAQVINFLGLLLQSTVQGASGSVALEGLLQNVTTSFVLGDVIYLSKTGGLTATVPDIGVASFVAGDFVVKVGKITKNASNPANKDLKLEIEILAQL